MNKPSQKTRVINKLYRDKIITRNQCLSVVPAITRLSAIIKILENEGWSFEREYFKRDYRYFVKECPPKQELLIK